MVGASPVRSRSGGRALGYLLDHGYGGEVYPVNPRYDDIDGRKCYASVADLPDPVDMAIVCVPAGASAAVVRECGERGIGLAVVHANGFGSAGDPEYDALAAAVRDTGIRVVGPNSVGLRAAHIGLFAEAGGSLAAMGYSDGPIAMIGQSGGLVTYFGSTFPAQHGCGARYVLDTGNEIDVDSADMIDIVAADPYIRAIGLIIEGVKDGRKLLASATSARAKGKTLFILRLGRTAAGAEAAISHTGSLAGDAEVFEQLVAQAGALVCRTPGDVATGLVLAARGVRSGAGGLGVVTPSGGFAVLSHDLAERYGVWMPIPTVPPPPSVAEAFGDTAFTNPIDINSVPTVPPAQVFGDAVRHMLNQPDIQTALIWLPYQFSVEGLPGSMLDILVEQAPVARELNKSLAMCGRVHPAVNELLHRHNITTFDKPEDFFAAFGVFSGARTSVVAAAPNGRYRRATPSAASTGEIGAGEIVTGPAAEAIATPAGVTFAPSRVVGSADEAVAFSRQIRGPIFLKVEAPGLAHKSDLGGVAGPLRPVEEIVEAWATIGEVAGRQPGSVVVAQAAVRGVEIVVSGFRDATFGPVVMVGGGGTMVEWKRDVAFATAPVTAARVGQLLTTLDAYRLLAGYRGSGPADTVALANLVVAVSRLISDPALGLREVELNPVVVGPLGSGVFAVDCVVIRGAAAGGGSRDGRSQT